MIEREIKLNDKQKLITKSSTIENLFISGLGAGKSFLLGILAFILSSRGYDKDKKKCIKGTVGFLGAPVFDTLKNATLPQIIEAWDKMGLQEDIHYVINKRPPTSWNVRPYTKLSSNRIITFRWGGYIIADSLENYNKVRSIEFDYILVDELRDVKKEAFNVLRGRLRGKAFKKLAERDHNKELIALLEDHQGGHISDDEFNEETQRIMGYKFISVTTPPENPAFLEELMERPSITVVRGTSRDNVKNLPAGYIEGMEAVYDDLTIEREVEGKIVYDVKNKFARQFDRKKHVSEEAKYIPGRGIYLSFDFNLEPFVCVIWQQGYNADENEKTGQFKNQVPFIHYIDEMYIMKEHQTSDKTYIETMCEQILERYKGEWIEVTGDSTEKKGSITAKPNISAYTEIIKFLNIEEDQLTLVPNPLVKRNRVLCNSILGRHPDILFNPKCKELIKDLELVGVDENGDMMKDKDSRRSHLLDAWRYSLNTFHKDFIQIER